jgi:hypothetical protein
MCVSGFQFRLILNKLHCIIFAMPCIPSHDHADSFAVVVSVHLLFVIVICFFSDRTLRGVVSNDKFFGCSSTIFPGKLPAPYLFIGVLITYLCLCFMLYSLC